MLKTVTAAAALLVAIPAAAQETARVEQLTFESPSLAGNLEGNSTERTVFVVTPPGYDENPDRRYPVVYFLHGFWAPAEEQQAGFRLHEAVQQSSDAGHDFIMVMPDGFSRLRGGYYSSGPTVGDYESMVADDLVAWVDTNYRTIADPASRGLAGHSMGGYGTVRIAMHRPGIFSSIYMMSACCLDPSVITAEVAAQIEAATPEEVEAASFFEMATISSLVAWSPDPSDEGFLKVYTGLREDGTLDPLVNHRLAANAPQVLLPQFVPELSALEGFAMDIGDQDFLLEGNRLWREELDRFGVNYEFELYEGDHGNRIAERLGTHVLPFFADHLDTE